MVKRTKTVEIEEADLDNQTEEVELVDDEINLIDEVSRVSDILRGGSTELELRVYRIPKLGGQKRPFLFRMEPEDVTALEERLQEAYGSGEYEVRLWDGRTIHRRIRIEVEAPVKKIDNAPVQAPDTSNLIREMMTSFQTALITQQQETKIMVLEMMTKMKPAEQGSMMDMIKALVALKQLEPQQERTSPAQQLAEIMQIMDGVKELREDIEPPTEIGSLAKTVGDLIVAARSMPQQPQPPMQQKQFSHPVAPTVPTTITTTNPAPQPLPQTESDMLVILLKKEIQKLVKHAKADHDPDTYAQVLIDDLPELYLNKLTDFIQKESEECVTLMIEMVPEVATYKEWFLDFVDALQDLLIADLQETADSGITGETMPELELTVPNAIIPPDDHNA